MTRATSVNEINRFSERSARRYCAAYPARHDRSTPIRACTYCVIAGGVILAGCGHRERAGVDVRGVVWRSGKPLASGVVSFRPDPARGNSSLGHPTGSIDAQGRFQLFESAKTQIPIGWYKVVVFAHEPPPAGGRGSHSGLPRPIIQGKYSDEHTTPLAVEVISDAPRGAYDLQVD